MIDPVPHATIIKLYEQAGGSNQVASLLHVDIRTASRWLSGQATMPWGAAECLLAYIENRPPSLP